MKKSVYLILILSVLFSTCTNNNSNRKDITDSEVVKVVHLENQDEGRNIIEKLSNIYGQNMIETPQCPFIEGYYFDEHNYIVLQVRGDSIAIRDSIERATGSKSFNLEMIKEGRFSQKELNEILNKMREREDTVTDEILKENIVFSGMGAHYIYVNFIRDTPEMRKAFREKISDSPAIKFGCAVSPIENNKVCPSDTLDISLKPEYSVYADTASKIPIILLNNTNHIIGCGEHYTVTYQDEKGTWRNLPNNGFAFDILYSVFSKEYFRTYASLHPKINHNKPGKYRFYYKINLNPQDCESKEIEMMTEFTLTNDYEAVKNATRIELPK